jgi:hypothetical protein
MDDAGIRKFNRMEKDIIEIKVMLEGQAKSIARIEGAMDAITPVRERVIILEKETQTLKERVDRQEASLRWVVLAILASVIGAVMNLILKGVTLT